MPLTLSVSRCATSLIAVGWRRLRCARISPMRKVLTDAHFGPRAFYLIIPRPRELLFERLVLGSTNGYICRSIRSSNSARDLMHRRPNDKGALPFALRALDGHSLLGLFAGRNRTLHARTNDAAKVKRGTNLNLHAYGVGGAVTELTFYQNRLVSSMV